MIREYNTSRDQPFIDFDVWDHDTIGKDECRKQIFINSIITLLHSSEHSKYYFHRP